MSSAQEQHAEKLLDEGHAAANRDDFSLAARLFAEAAEAYGQLPGGVEQKALLLHLTSTFHQELGDLAAAEAAARESLQLFFEEVPDSVVDQARAMNTLGEILSEAENFEEAASTYTGAVNAFYAAQETGVVDEESDTESELVQALMGLGLAAVNSEQWQEGAAAYQQAIDHLRMWPDMDVPLGVCWMGLGGAFLQGEDLELSSRALDQALLFLADQPEAAALLANTWAIYGQVHEAANRIPEAIAAQETAHQIYSELGAVEDLADTEERLANLRAIQSGA